MCGSCFRMLAVPPLVSDFKGERMGRDSRGAVDRNVGIQYPLQYYSLLSGIHREHTLEIAATCSHYIQVRSEDTFPLLKQDGGSIKQEQTACIHTAVFHWISGPVYLQKTKKTKTKKPQIKSKTKCCHFVFRSLCR